MNKNKTIQTIIRLLKNTKLPDKETKILISRLLNKTLSEIGEEYGMTRERIRQLETKGLKKLSSRWRWGGVKSRLKNYNPNKTVAVRKPWYYKKWD